MKNQDSVKGGRGQRQLSLTRVPSGRGCRFLIELHSPTLTKLPSARIPDRGALLCILLGISILLGMHAKKYGFGTQPILLGNIIPTITTEEHYFAYYWAYPYYWTCMPRSMGWVHNPYYLAISYPVAPPRLASWKLDRNPSRDEMGRMEISGAPLL